MLVLSRDQNERIVIVVPDGRELVVSIASVRGNSVRLAFDVPSDVKVWRQEALDRLKRDDAERRRYRAG